MRGEKGQWCGFIKGRLVDPFTSIIPRKISKQTALRQYRQGRISLREARDIYNIPKSTLQRAANRELPKYGGQAILSPVEENSLIDLIILASEWGYPLDRLEIRLMVQQYQNRKGITGTKFQNNLPGLDLFKAFMKRHRHRLTERMAENIKRSRAAISPEVIRENFANLEMAITNVSPECIVNYDETCFVDDPGKRKVICRRGCKHPERIIDSTKSSTSVMFSVSANGVMLPPFVVYISSTKGDMNAFKSLGFVFPLYIPITIGAMSGISYVKKYRPKLIFRAPV